MPPVSAHSPSISNTGAWSKYAATGLSVELPRDLLPNDIGVSLSGVVGYFWFGNLVLQRLPVAGLYPLECRSYVQPQDVQSGFLVIHINLSKEDCFVFYGDPGAVPGGRINPIRIQTGWSRTGAVPLWSRSYGLR